jgi:hypothetical protein
MELEKESLDYLEQLFERTQESFEGLSARWDGLQPRRKFDVKTSEDFHLGFVFGKLDDDFIGWFYSKYGRSMTDQEYRQFWKKCRELVRILHKKYDVFYFQE